MYCITMKNKAKDLQAYWVTLTEMVQVTYLKIKKGNKTNLCMKSCKNSVVDTSGHKHRECIVWTKSNITIRAKIVDQQAIFFDAAWSNLFHLAYLVTSPVVKSRKITFQVVSHTHKNDLKPRRAT